MSKIPPKFKEGVWVYAHFLLCCSLCAPRGFTSEQIVAGAERQYPCGTTNGWAISNDAAFAGGEPMPCPCPDDPDRQHWLLEA